MCDKKSIIRFLNELGVPSNYLGYNYIIEASLIIIEETNHNKKIKLKDVNAEISHLFNTTSGSIKRDIGSCIDSMFKYAKTRNIDKVFENVSNYYDERPTNKLFLLTIVNYLMSEL